MRRFGLLLAALLCLVCRRGVGGRLHSARPGGRQLRLRPHPDLALSRRRHATGAQAGRAGRRRGDPQAGLGRRRSRMGDAHRAGRRDRRRSGCRWPRRRCVARRPMPAAPCRPPGRTSPPPTPARPRCQSLLLMAEALQALNRPAQAIQALEAAAERAPDNKTIAAEAGRDPPRHRHPGPPRRHRARGRTAARLHRLHRRARPPRRFPRRGLGAARSTGAGRGGHTRGRPDLRLRPALRRHHADRAARRHARRVRPQPGQGHRAEHRHGQPPPAHRLRHAACSCCRVARPLRSGSARSTYPASS